jgi:hypothetical protein
MEMIGYVNAEGGPLLVADGLLLASWKGIEGPDYDRACAIFDSDPGLEGTQIEVGSGNAIIWEMKGAGTAFVFKLSEGHFCITRVWPRDPRDSNVPRMIAERPTGQMVNLGNLRVESGNLTVLWAAEQGVGMELPAHLDAGYPPVDMSIDTAGFIVRVPQTSFACFHDQIELSSGIGRRLHLMAL